MKKNGFSIMELMIVMAIIGILSGLGYVGYSKFIANAKQTEAKSLLSSIYKAQNFYFMVHDKYSSDLNDLNITIPNDLRYSYSINLSNSDLSFDAIAEGNIDGDPILDKWKINESNQLTHEVDDTN